jgi:hypothetical protein
VEIPFDLTCWYLNSRRVLELVGGEAVYGRLAAVANLHGQLRKNAELQIQKDALTDWLRTTNPPPLGKLIVEAKLKEGALFTHYSNFFFRGLPGVRAAIRKGNDAPLAEAYSKVKNWSSDGRVVFKFHHEHLTSNSSWSELSGQKRLLVLGLIKKIDIGVIEAIPYVIANPAPGLFESGKWGFYWQNYLEVHVDEIDTFASVRDMLTRPTKKSLDYLRAISEDAIKNAFAEIIGEPTVPKDWGGERSDLFSSRVEIDGTRISTAFAFKGPAQFRPMTMAQLGKNGDQIDRLFAEPADLFVLQHCHEITSPVRGAMRAYAQQIGRPRLYCVIDGYDTIRILRAYGKCGFGIHGAPDESHAAEHPGVS